jgi:hypothetical protein
MIKFFRKIRQRLLTENKFSKYLLYAIGEIVLVVIGILIALQINNWNEVKKTERKEAAYLANILRDLHDQSESIAVQMKYEKGFFEAAGYILEQYHANSLTLDSTFYGHATRLSTRKTFLITDPTYTDLISSGNINVINNTERKDRLIKYYQELERIEKVIQSNNSLLVDQQYGPVFNMIGYFYAAAIPNYRSNISNIGQSSTVLPVADYLKEISQRLFLSEEKKLALFNVVTLRHQIAMDHYAYMMDMMSRTETLINEFEKSVDIGRSK